MTKDTDLKHGAAYLIEASFGIEPLTSAEIVLHSVFPLNQVAKRFEELESQFDFRQVTTRPHVLSAIGSLEDPIAYFNKRKETSGFKGGAIYNHLETLRNTLNLYFSWYACATHFHFPEPLIEKTWRSMSGSIFRVQREIISSLDYKPEPDYLSYKDAIRRFSESDRQKLTRLCKPLYTASSKEFWWENESDKKTLRNTKNYKKLARDLPEFKRIVNFDTLFHKYFGSDVYVNRMEEEFVSMGLSGEIALALNEYGDRNYEHASLALRSSLWNVARITSYILHVVDKVNQ